ncbi:hypothetical protein ACMFKE_04960 [Staphylococcus haemolyticus]|uniref:hypothetical protein n=1 Tax=Staphylococcus haemolyticus TaxID=1283 RepID=UPI0039BD6696
MLEIKNADLVQTKSFLYDLKLKPQLSRHRTKLIKLLDDKIKDLTESSTELIKQYAKKDDNDNPIINGNLIEFDNATNRIAFEKEDAILANEVSHINLEEYPNVYDAIKQALSELDIELDKEKANTFELLCELFNVE